MRRKTGWAVVLFALAAADSSFAQVTQFEGQKVVSIQYAPAQFLDPVDLATAQPVKVGDALHANEVAEAIDGLFATGRFDDISVEAEKSGTGVSIRFVTKPRTFIGSVNLNGKMTAPPDKAGLQSVTQLNLGGQFRDEDVTHAVDAMTRLFKANGLYDASVEPKIERPNPDAGGPQQVFITFEVKSGKRAKYEMPQITGTEAPLSENTILRATGWRVPLVHWWRHVTSAKTHGGAQAVQAKYESKDRLTARVDLKQVDYDEQKRRVLPHLDITPGPVVKVTTVESKLSQRTLKKYVPVFEERDVDNDLLVEGERNLHDYLQSQGYYDADVTFRVQPPKNDLETIEYVISKGQRYRLVHLATSGNKYFDQGTLRERMFIAPKAFNLRRGRYSDAFRRRDEASISDLYKANGFRDVKVEIAEERDYRGKAGDVAVTMNITEGTQWLVQSLTVNGVSPALKKDVLANMSSLEGEPFSEVTLAADRDSILTWYYTNGYPNANFKAEWRNASATKVDLVYTITEGKREYVRAVLLHGLHTTRQGTVNRRISLKAGDPLSPVEMTDIQRKLYDLGVFARVDTAIENPDGDTTHKYVLYDLEEANRYSVSVGLGAQVARFGQPSAYSLGSPAGTTGFSPEASLSVSRLNFLGLGHTVTLHGVYSTIDKSASLSYEQPKFLGSDTRTVTYSLVYDNEIDVRTFASKREEASVQLSQRLSKSMTALFRYAYRKVSVNGVVIPTLLIPQLLQPVRLSMVSGNLVRDTRDNASNPHRGSLNSVDLRLAANFLGSQRSFGAALVRNATYYALTKNLILARQTEFGVIAPFAAPAGLTEEESVPLPERFFAGGADSLRAFAFNEAGPRDTGAPVVPGGPVSQPTGFPLGGNALFINNIELRFPLIGDNIQGVLFHDMGNVFSSLSDMSFRFRQRNLQDFNYTVHAVGFGIRYKTPVGPVRADLAYSINSPEFDGFSGTPQQLLLCNPNNPVSLQQSFCQVTTQNTGHVQFFFSIGQTF
jgi:outer membrane protein assembly complex protein YaeT